MEFGSFFQLHVFGLATRCYLIAILNLCFGIESKKSIHENYIDIKFTCGIYESTLACPCIQ